MKKSNKIVFSIKFIIVITISLLALCGFMNKKDYVISIPTMKMNNSSVANQIPASLAASEVAYNWMSKKTFILKNGSIVAEVPYGWDTEDVSGDDYAAGILLSGDGISNIQLYSSNLDENDKTATPDSLINGLEIGNHPGGKVSHKILSDHTATISYIKGKTVEISGTDELGQDIHGLITVLVGGKKIYVICCMTTEEEFSRQKDTFIKVAKSVILY